jgi:hypothetical protein
MVREEGTATFLKKLSVRDKLYMGMADLSDSCTDIRKLRRKFCASILALFTSYTSAVLMSTLPYFLTNIGRPCNFLGYKGLNNTSPRSLKRG